MRCQKRCCGAADLGVAGHAPETMDAGVRHPVQVVCHRAAGHFALHVIISRRWLVELATTGLLLAIVPMSTTLSRKSLDTVSGMKRIERALLGITVSAMLTAQACMTIVITSVMSAESTPGMAACWRLLE